MADGDAEDVTFMQQLFVSVINGIRFVAGGRKRAPRTQTD
jgi:hypothetical protein